MLDADMIGSMTTFAGPTAASFLTTRYWAAREDADPRRHAWFVLYLAVVLALLVAVLSTAAPEDRLKTVGLFFVVTILATALQERRARRARRINDADRGTPE